MFFLFAELQKATGLRVLRRVVERQQSLERDDENFLRQLRQTGVNAINICPMNFFRTNDFYPYYVFLGQN